MNTLALLFCLAASAMAVPMLDQVPQLTDTRIVGGTIAAEGEFPYQVSLQKSSLFGTYHFCGGSVLNGNTILTASHCLAGASASSITAVAGEYSMASNSGHEQSASASRLVMHQAYNSRTMENDVAVVHLSRTLSFNSYVEPITLPRAGSDTAAGTLCTVTGWGTTSSGGSAPDLLHKVSVTVVSDRSCSTSYGGGIYDSMICAGDPGKDSCQGDSGGPFYCNGAQVGIVSWGYGCADPRYPGVYTQVSYFVSWINSNLKM